MKKTALSLLFTATAGTLFGAPKPAPTPPSTTVSPVPAAVDDTGWTTPRPPYPEAARKGKLSGSVRLRVSTDRNGRVRKASVVQSSGHQELDDATVEFAKANWTGPRYSQAVYVQNYTYGRR